MRLAGKRAVLRDWRLTDLDAWGEWMRPEHRWHELDGPYYPRPSTDYVVQRKLDLKAKIAAGRWPKPRHELVIADRASDRLVGLVTLAWESKETHWPLAGVVIYDDTFWGRGVGFEALGLWTDYLFENLPDIVRMDLRTWSGNVGMMRLAEKLGYRLEAVFRQARIVAGAYYDGLGYGVLREEWRKLYPRGFLEAL